MVGRGLADQGYLSVCTGSRTPNCSFSDSDFRNFMADKSPVKDNYVLINRDKVKIPSCKSTIGDEGTYLQSGPVASIYGQEPPGVPPYNTVTAYVYKVLPLDDRTVYYDASAAQFWKFRPLLTQIPPFSFFPALLKGASQCPQQNVDFSKQPDFVNTTGNALDTLGWALQAFGAGTDPWYVALVKAGGTWPEFSGFVVRTDQPFSLGTPWAANNACDTYSYQPLSYKTIAGGNTVSGLWSAVSNPAF
jgi:hypothetical protein